MVNLVAGHVLDSSACRGVMATPLEAMEACDVTYSSILCVANEEAGKWSSEETERHDNHSNTGKIDCSVNFLLGNKKGGSVNAAEKVSGLTVKLGKSVTAEASLFG